MKKSSQPTWYNPKHWGKLLTLYLPIGSARAARRRQYRKMLKAETASERFEQIYSQNLWNDRDSVSGRGSSLETTHNVRSRLPEIFSEYGVKRFLDAPCGDFHWMKDVVVHQPELLYIGGDIVPALIQENTNRHASQQVSFTRLDITSDTLPPSDMMMVRDCLFHLSYADIGSFLHNLAKSNIELLLTTSHYEATTPIENYDIVSGDFRLIDLFAQPFCFPEKPLLEFDDSDEKNHRKKLCLFNVQQLITHLEEYSTLYRGNLLRTIPV